MLVDARRVEFGDDAIVHLDFHERLEVHIGNARGRTVDGEQQVDVLLAEFAAADFPIALADGGDAVEHAIIVAEFALGVALVGFADGAQARTQQARAAARREFCVRPHVICAALQGFQPGDLAA